MTRHRSFSVKAVSKDLDPITFEVDGETYTAKPHLQGMALLDFIEASGSGGAESVKAVNNLFKEALGEEEYERFHKNTTDSTDADIDVEVLVEISTFLVEEYTSRPTEASKAK